MRPGDEEEMLTKDEPSPAPMCHRAKCGDRTTGLRAGGVPRCRSPSSGHGLVSACQRSCSSTPGAVGEGLGEGCAPPRRRRCSTATSAVTAPRHHQPGIFFPEVAKRRENYTVIQTTLQKADVLPAGSAEALRACCGMCTVPQTCTAAAAMPP